MPMFPGISALQTTSLALALQAPARSLGMASDGLKVDKIMFFLSLGSLGIATFHDMFILAVDIL